MQSDTIKEEKRLIATKVTVQSDTIKHIACNGRDLPKVWLNENQ